MLAINNTLDGYLKDVEIKGNTIQDASNLADIRSVGDIVEGQELYEIPVLSCGKNLLNKNNVTLNAKVDSSGNIISDTNINLSDYIKLKANKTYCKSNSDMYAIYDDNKNFISRSAGEVISLSNDGYVRLFISSSVNLSTYQLEEGTVATPYESYQEDKLTILSPVQLEKVGDVADRIIEKDGVWGVEKNVVTILLDGSESGKYEIESSAWYDDTTYAFHYKVSGYNISVDDNSKQMIICDKLISNSANYVMHNDKSTPMICGHSNGFAIFRLKRESLDDFTKGSLCKFLSSNNMCIKYPTTQPQFIPLPHDQQIKLRTFASKTNISFLTEIEGTVKAQVPKSLGATVNTHTEQINNLNKELDRVKKLEESTVSTVTTESDFTTVEATSNGYFEDVKLEGKTLVNLANNSNNIPNPNINHNVIYPMILDVKNKNYTLVIKLNTSKQLNCKYAYTDGTLGNDFKFCDANVNGVVTKLITPNMLPIDFDKEVNGFRLSVVGGTPLDVTIDYIEFLEGDHTQNPPAYFEGLKSVGDGADEVSVESVGDGINNTDNDFTEIYIATGLEGRDRAVITTGLNRISVDDGKVYLYRNGERYSDIVTKRYYSKNKIYLGATYTNDAYYVRFRFLNASGNYEGDISEYKILNSTMKESQTDKKRLLYYNNETQTWEKPILRQWDSIEKHSDGKYYYHQRSGEVVLNGSENWSLPTSSGQIDTNWETETHIAFRTSDLINPKDVVWGSQQTCICDRFKVSILNNTTYTLSDEFIGQNRTGVDIKISKSKLSTQDVVGFKQWLQANNVTVVYQLAQEKVYECTNIDLITYANETNYIVESGAIVPRSTLKVHNNISNVVSLLQKKVSLLESNITSYMITQNRLQLSSTYSADSVTFKVDYFAEKSVTSYDNDLFNLILNNIIVGKENYDYDKMFNIIMDYASWSQISWDQFDILVGVMDLQHNPPIEPPIEEVPSETPEE